MWIHCFKWTFQITSTLQMERSGELLPPCESGGQAGYLWHRFDSHACHFLLGTELTVNSSDSWTPAVLRAFPPAHKNINQSHAIISGCHGAHGLTVGLTFVSVSEGVRSHSKFSELKVQVTVMLLSCSVMMVLKVASGEQACVSVCCTVSFCSLSSCFWFCMDSSAYLFKCPPSFGAAKQRTADSCCNLNLITATPMFSDPSTAPV